MMAAYSTYDDDDVSSNPTPTPCMADVVARRMSRRAILKATGATIATTAMIPHLGGAHAQAASQESVSAVSSLTFKELPHGMDGTHAVAPGHSVRTLLRWGDPVVKGAPKWDPYAQTAAAQSQQFGYNCDYVGFLPLPLYSDNADHGLLCVNHEYTNAHLMFPGLQKGDLDAMTKDMVDIEMAAHGHSVVEIKRTQGVWDIVADSPYNRRITALDTIMAISGPAAGHPRLQTQDDPTGRTVIGTLNNCAGGHTPWGTVLIAEENFHSYFSGDITQTAEETNYKRYGLKKQAAYAWSRFHDRFDINKTPNEPNRFGWMVEIDPYTPGSTPIKRTALGRFKHEGATCLINKDDRLVVYSGDDQRFDYIYKFVSHGRYTPQDRAANSALLDDGTLYVAKFHTDGRLTWLPLVHGDAPLTAENGFYSQADVLIETRRAADLLGATPMDRPEDVEPNPVSGVVYVNLTNNTKRTESQVDAANPRPHNVHGHVIELIPPGTSAAGKAHHADHSATTYTWDIFLKAGNPAIATDGAHYHPETSKNGWLSCPDNMAFDQKGRIWIATDGAPKAGIADGVWAADVAGLGRALTRHFYRTPLGAELCGPCFTPDDTTYFAAVQHPGDTKGSTFDHPSTRWPDFDNTIPPRPSVQVIQRQDNGAIG
jgi:secreted PhoX family phosphatase